MCLWILAEDDSTLMRVLRNACHYCFQLDLIVDTQIYRYCGDIGPLATLMDTV